MIDEFIRLAEHIPPKPRERPDGDTMNVRIDLGMHTQKLTRFRLARINCPELSEPDGSGFRARDAMRALWPFNTQLYARTFVDPTDKYGRWIAEVWLPTGDLLSDILVASGHAIYKSYLARPTLPFWEQPNETT